MESSWFKESFKMGLFEFYFMCKCTVVLYMYTCTIYGNVLPFLTGCYGKVEYIQGSLL